MAQILRPYVSQDVVVTWDGIPIEAFADTYVNVSYVEDQTITTQAPDGPVANTLKPATVGTIEITLQQNSPANRALGTAFAAAKLSNTFVQGPLIVRDPSGGTLYTANDAHIMRPPDTPLGASHEDGLRTWTFTCANLIPISFPVENLL